MSHAVFTLTLDPKQLDYIANVLAARPYAEVSQLLQNITEQVRQQQQPKTEALRAVNE